jgi:anti-sigma factor RsiW
MKCVLNKLEQEELLVNYVFGSLDLDTANTYRHHLDTCPECQELVDLQIAVHKTMGEWEAPTVSADFDRKLLSRIRETAAAPSAWLRFVRWIGWPPAQYPVRWAMACAPVAALAIGLAFWPAAPVDTALVEADDLQEVERTLDDLEALQALHNADGAPGEAL